MRNSMADTCARFFFFRELRHSCFSLHFAKLSRIGIWYIAILIMDLRSELQSMNPPRNYRGLRFLKNQRRGDQYFLLNIRGAFRRKREPKHCFSLVNYGIYALSLVFHLCLFFFWLLLTPQMVVISNQILALCCL